ncbi:MAG TPA: Fe-S cluster assembly protein SufD [Longimicrobiaceae bacterium]
MADTTLAESLGVFTRDQTEILSTRKLEPEWLRTQRLQAYDAFVAMPMPTTREEEWRYTDIGRRLQIESLDLADEHAPVRSLDELPEGLRTLIEAAGQSSASVVQVDASVVQRELSEELATRGVILTSLEQAVSEYADLVQRYLGTAVNAEDGKFAALNTANWTGGTFLFVPRNVKVELPVRSFRWISDEGSALFGRTLIVAEENAEVVVMDEVGSADFERQSFSNAAAEILAGEGAKVTYVSLQRWGSGVIHLTTDRLVAGRDARITTLYTTLGSDLTRADVRCRLQAPGAHVDMLGLYLGEGKQHFDHETLQDHVAPHASSNLLFKGALNDEARSVFRGLIRVHPGAQRTDAYQTNRNLVLSNRARADSLPNLEIGADDVRCSHAATVGQLDEEEIFYLLSRGIPRPEAMRLVIFGFFGEVLEQLEVPEVRAEIVRAIERKLFGGRRA